MGTRQDEFSHAPCLILTPMKDSGWFLPPPCDDVLVSSFNPTIIMVKRITAQCVTKIPSVFPELLGAA